MFVTLTTALILIACVAAVLAAKHYAGRREPDPPILPPPSEHFRPLFAPTEEELRTEERELAIAKTAKREDEQRRKHEKDIQKLEMERYAWIESPDRASAVGLLYRSAQLSGAGFIETSEAIVAAWREDRLADISSTEIAELLESHYHLLPAKQKTPGSSFKLKEMLEELRS